MPASRPVANNGTLSPIDAGFMMNHRRIFIANLSKGRLGEDKSNLLGAILVTSFQWLAAMGASERARKRNAKIFFCSWMSFRILRQIVSLRFCRRAASIIWPSHSATNMSRSSESTSGIRYLATSDQSWRFESGVRMRNCWLENLTESIIRGGTRNWTGTKSARRFLLKSGTASHSWA